MKAILMGMIFALAALVALPGYAATEASYSSTTTYTTYSPSEYDKFHFYGGTKPAVALEKYNRAKYNETLATTEYEVSEFDSGTVRSERDTPFRDQGTKPVVLHSELEPAAAPAYRQTGADLRDEGTKPIVERTRVIEKGNTELVNPGVNPDDDLMNDVQL